MSGQRDTAQLTSDGAALLLTAAAMALFLTAGQRLLLEHLARAAAADRPFELSLQSLQPQAPPAPQPTLPTRREKHQRVPQPPHAPANPPVEQQPVSADAAALAEVTAPQSAAKAEISRPDLEALYAAQLRADIDGRKHPPDSAQYRLRHPYGEVRVRFMVLRDGQPQAVSIVRSSGSAILDQEALQLVSSGHYPPMPAKAFVGESQHAFLVTVEFPPAHLTRRSTASEGVAA